MIPQHARAALALIPIDCKCASDRYRAMLARAGNLSV